jgi:MoxR-like ATPase
VSTADRISEYLAQFSQTRSLMIDQLRRIVIGQSEVIEQIMAAIFTRGHCLLVGVPGLAKTLMVSSLSQILDVSFKRIQFTPDLMPSDITGTTVLDEHESGRREFRFVRGPLFANIILADEINRTPPKTQAALLQAMQERQVTVGQETYNLPDPFFVIATQNPIEQEGTYPLPEAQLDRFMFNIKVDYPSVEEEKRILATTTRDEPPELTKVLSGKAIVNLQKLVRSVPVGDYVIDYVTRLVRATRPKDPTAPDFVRKMVDWGAGPRAGIFLIQGGKALAAMDGRFSVAIDDIKKAAIPVLRHRISTNFQAQAEGKTSEDIIQQLLATVGEPEPAKYQPRRRG